METFCAPSGPMILIVDDCADGRNALALLLALAGFRTATAADGQDALDYLSANPPPSLIVLDLRMPVMDGLTFRARQMEDPQLAPIPVVVFTAERGAEAYSALAGVAAIVCKPADPEELIRLARAYAPAAEAPAG